MFSRWFKRRDKDPKLGIQELAKSLAIERRAHVRIKAPKLKLSLLPVFSANGQTLLLQDLSVGGCCLLDYHEVLGSSVGREIDLSLRWGTHQIEVTARIVLRAHWRRHLQFLNLPESWSTRIRSAIDSGVRGLALRVNLPPLLSGPTLEVPEIWLSSRGDSVCFQNDVLIRAEATIGDQFFRIFFEAWPRKPDSTPLNRDEFEELLLFLSNIPNPSALVLDLIVDLERMHRARLI